MNIELIGYILDELLQLKEMEKSIDVCVNMEKILLLLEEWIEKHRDFSKDELDRFFYNVRQMICAESEIRKIEVERKSIWLTK